MRFNNIYGRRGDGVRLYSWHSGGRSRPLSVEFEPGMFYIVNSRAAGLLLHRGSLSEKKKGGLYPSLAHSGTILSTYTYTHAHIPPTHTHTLKHTQTVGFRKEKIALELALYCYCSTLTALTQKGVQAEQQQILTKSKHHCFYRALVS